jgi:hypothetical protein
MCQQTNSMFTKQRSPFLQVLLGARLVTEILVVLILLRLLLGITGLLHVPHLVTNSPLRRHPIPLAQCAVGSRGLLPCLRGFHLQTRAGQLIYKYFDTRLKFLTELRPSYFLCVCATPCTAANLAHFRFFPSTARCISRVSLRTSSGDSLRTSLHCFHSFFSVFVTPTSSSSPAPWPRSRLFQNSASQSPLWMPKSPSLLCTRSNVVVCLHTPRFIALR